MFSVSRQSLSFGFSAFLCEDLGSSSALNVPRAPLNAEDAEVFAEDAEKTEIRTTFVRLEICRSHNCSARISGSASREILLCAWRSGFKAYDH